MENSYKLLLPGMFKKKRIINWIYILLFLASVVFFAYTAIYQLPVISKKDIFSSFLISEVDFLKPYWIIISIVIISLILSVLHLSKKGRLKKKNAKSKSSLKPILESIVVVLGSSLAGFLFSLLLTFLIAILQINFLSVQLRVNPESTNIIWGKDSVKGQIEKMNDSPNVIESDYNNLTKEIVNISLESGSYGEFYKKIVITNIPNTLIYPINIPKESLFLVGNKNLIVTELKIDDLQAISPSLAYLLVKNYFDPRYLKNNPDLNVLGRQDYLKVREEQINDQLSIIFDYIGRVQRAIGNQNAIISDDKDKIAINQSNLTSSLQYKVSESELCMSYGYYDFFTGIFRHTYTQEYCNTLASSKWDPIIDRFKSNISDWNQQLKQDQTLLAALIYIKDLLDNYRVIISSQKDTAPRELGVFHNQNKIEIALDWTNSESIYNYLETLVHEYLHFTSYVSDSSTLPRFFEEGLTEYYARQIIKKTLDEDINLGYPLIVRVIKQMMTRLPQKELEHIYFTKDQNSLIAILDNTYGKDFYENNTLSFNILPLLSDKDALKLVNEIMKSIGGEEIRESDIYTANADDLVNIVKQFYNYIGAKQLDATWGLLSKNFQNYVQGHDHFVNGYSSTLNVFIDDIYIQDLSTNTVYIKFRSADDVNGKTQYKIWSGIWQLIQEDGVWKLDNANITQLDTTK